MITILTLILAVNVTSLSYAVLRDRKIFKAQADADTRNVRMEKHVKNRDELTAARDELVALQNRKIMESTCAAMDAQRDYYWGGK